MGLRRCWSRQAPADRKRTLLRFADLLEANLEELALLDSLEGGKPITDTREVDVPDAVHTFRWFAEAIDKYKGLGASVIGVSSDDIATLNKFSVSECRSKFPVAADADKKIMTAYDAKLAFGYANRTSCVIAPDGRIIYEYTALDPSGHVENTLAAVEKWKAGGK